MNYFSTVFNEKSIAYNLHATSYSSASDSNRDEIVYINFSNVVYEIVQETLNLSLSVKSISPDLIFL